MPENPVSRAAHEPSASARHLGEREQSQRVAHGARHCELHRAPPGRERCARALLSGHALTAQLCAESARVLEPGGSLLILNAQYGADANTELFELEQLAEDADLEIHRADWSPLDSWDAPAFQLKHAVRSRA